MTLAFGELDPGFGDHPAFLVLAQDGVSLRGPALVVPGDSSAARLVPGVRRIAVGVANPEAVEPPSPGAVELRHRRPRAHALRPVPRPAAGAHR